MHPETLRQKVRQVEADAGAGTDLLTTEEREEIRKLRNEVGAGRIDDQRPVN